MASPLGDGKSGAPGNQTSYSSQHIGKNIPQRTGAPDFNSGSVVPGGRLPLVEPPSDRGQTVGMTATKPRKPFNLSGGAKVDAEGFGSEVAPGSTTADDADTQPVGDVPVPDKTDY